MINHSHPIVQKLAESHLDLDLVGSRLMNSHGVYSDYDFYCACDWVPAGYTRHEYVRKTLLDLGFVEIGSSGYHDDAGILMLYRHTPALTPGQPNSESVDVLCMSSKEKAHRLMCLEKIRCPGHAYGAGQELVAALKGKGLSWKLLFDLMRP